MLAAKLSNSGQHVLRFDYYGTGDSAGEAASGSQPGWIEDILEAHEELQASSSVSRVIWIGLRYGATLAALAAQNLRRPLAGLVLWDPIVDGGAYLHELTACHAEFMRQEVRDWQPSSPAGSESLGFPLSRDLKNAIGDTNLCKAKPPKTRRITVVTTNSNNHPSDFRSSAESWAPSSTWLDMPISSQWNSDQAMNAMLVPSEVLDSIVAVVRGTP
jgi:pimeloyl-ACP methyl ester carboxylesterase